MTVSRLWLRRGRYWWDDAWAFFSLLCLLIQFVSVFMHVENPNDLSKTSRIAAYYLMATTFYTVIWSARLSILFSIIRIDPDPAWRLRLRWIAGIFIGALVLLPRAAQCGCASPSRLGRTPRARNASSTRRSRSVSLPGLASDGSTLATLGSREISRDFLRGTDVSAIEEVKSRACSRRSSPITLIDCACNHLAESCIAILKLGVPVLSRSRLGLAATRKRPIIAAASIRAQDGAHGACLFTADVIADLLLILLPLRLIHGIKDRVLRRRLIVIFSTSIVTTIVSLVHAVYIILGGGIKVIISALVEDCMSLSVANIPVTVTAFWRILGIHTQGRADDSYTDEPSDGPRFSTFRFKSRLTGLTGVFTTTGGGAGVTRPQLEGAESQIATTDGKDKAGVGVGLVLMTDTYDGRAHAKTKGSQYVSVGSLQGESQWESEASLSVAVGQDEARDAQYISIGSVRQETVHDAAEMPMPLRTLGPGADGRRIPVYHQVLKLPTRFLWAQGWTEEETVESLLTHDLDPSQSYRSHKLTSCLCAASLGTQRRRLQRLATVCAPFQRPPAAQCLTCCEIGSDGAVHLLQWQRTPPPVSITRRAD
ncbi:hypothetical protein EVG20_g7160 [Dentipellis fragilis]|uniref:Uncharacterized protein n=1 Tax=Dentipellis fragilis TaxID=205917 RepID=A0A4Y9YHT1_9AGAM|nr:hypothetical protein EVG20_g7160 [Dentipellis fragilis]